jgi:cystathionine beta-synthase
MRRAISPARGAVAGLVGNTALTQLTAISAGLTHRLWAKCEFMNPLGSVKDRIATFMIEEAVRAGQLRPGGTIVEATGGNTGVALAAVGATRGHRVVLTMSDKIGPDKVALLHAWGAEVVICDHRAAAGSDQHFVSTARAIAAETPDSFLVGQFDNPNNVEAHRRTTGPEIYAALDGDVGALVAGVGTGGTLMGAGGYLRQRDPAVRVVLADPAGSILAGAVTGVRVEPHSSLVEGIGSDWLPGLFEPSLVTDAVTVTDRDSFSMCLRLQREEGIFVGGSAGCAVAAARRFAETLDGPPTNIVVVLPETGTRAVATLYSASWRARHGLADLGG